MKMAPTYLCSGHGEPVLFMNASKSDVKIIKNTSNTDFARETLLFG